MLQKRSNWNHTNEPNETCERLNLDDGWIVDVLKLGVKPPG